MRFAMLSDTAGGWIVLAPHVAPRVAAAERADAVAMKVTCRQACVGPGSAGQSSSVELVLASTCHPLEEGYSLPTRRVAVRTKVCTHVAVW